MQKVLLLPLLLLFFTLSFLNLTVAQCPACQISVPSGIAEDTIYLGRIPDGRFAESYSENVSFRLPKTTTPVNATDPNIPPGLPINEITITSIANLPPGINWKANQDNYNPGSEPDGCIRLCGTPLVSGWYSLEVKLKATVVVVSQETSFFIDMYIAPALATNDGFSMDNYEGCGSIDVSFINNIPSNGNPGYSYFWDFGNGQTSTDENPADQTYDQPGIYFVNYQATVDTADYILTKVTLLESDCQDIFGAAPDILIKVYNASGATIYTSPKIENTFPPISFAVNIPLGDGAYAVEAIDEDSGLGGADDQCAYLNFNRLSNGIHIGPSFKMELEIIHPLSSSSFTDTVVVHPAPDQPNIAANRSKVCPGDSALLASSYIDHNQWYANGQLVAGATSRSFYVSTPGEYQVSYTNSFGCSALSEPFVFDLYDQPDAPEIASDRGDQICDGEETFLSSSYSQGNQWYQNGVLINGGTDVAILVNVAGSYSVEYTSADGCKAISTPFDLMVFALPEIPVFENNGNLLSLASVVDLPDNYSLQWQWNGTDLEGETEKELCATEDGTYSLFLLDETTGCSRTFSADVAIDPEVSCILGIQPLVDFQWRIAPNPANDWLQIQLDLTESKEIEAQLMDMSGRQLSHWDFGTQNGAFRETLDMTVWPGGMYLLRLRVGEQWQQLKVVKQ